MGEPRTTIDLDLLISKEARQRWSNLLEAEGFKEVNDGGPFVQFSPPYGTEWHLDLMLVNQETFAKLHSAARRAVMLGIATLVPCAEHLVGLKLHAMKFGPARRQDQDLLDVLTLIQNANLDPRSESFKKLVEQFGTAEIYERILRAQATRGS